MKKLICLIYIAVLAAMNLLPFTYSKASAAPVNLISNASVETVDPSNSNAPMDWSQGGWGTNTRTLTYPSTAHSGSRSVRVDITSYSNGDAKWYFKPVSVSPNTQYTYSDYYESNVANSLIAQYTDSSNNVTYQDLSSLPANASAWAQGSVNFTTPASAKTVTVFHYINSVGWLQTDDYSLTTFVAPTTPTVLVTSPSANANVTGVTQISADASDAASVAGVQFQVDGSNVGAEDIVAPYQVNWDSTTVVNGSHNITAIARNSSNLTTTSSAVPVTVTNSSSPPPVLPTNLINNSSVETVDPTNSALPQGWTNTKSGNNTTTFSYLNTGHTGNRSLQIQMTKRSSGNAEWTFNQVNVSPNTTYTFSDWYQSNVGTQMIAVVTRTGGGTTTVVNTPQTASSTWKKSTVSFKTPSDAKSVTVYQRLNTVGQVTTDDYDLEGPAPTAPSVNISAPANNASVSGTQIINASATDAKGIASVQFKLDGNNLGAADTSSPYSYSWDTTGVNDGAHTLSAVATNVYGMSTTAVNVSIDVHNQVTPPSSDNLIANPSVETPNPSNSSTPSQWQTNGWGTNTAQYSYLNSGHNSGHSVKTQITSYTSGDAKWAFTPVNVSPNTSYTYADYYQSSVDTEVVVAFTDTAGNTTFASLGAVPASIDWSIFTNSFTTPSNVKQLTVYHFLAKVGSLTIDDANLIVTPAIPQNGIVPNNSLETPAPANPTAPALWTKGNWGTNTPKFEYMNDGHTGSHSVKVTVSNYTDGDAKWYFNPITTLTPGKMYRLSLWYKTNTIPHVVAMFNMKDGTTKFFGMPNPFPNGTTDWQFYSDTFQVPIGAVSVSAFMFMPANGWVQTDDYSISDYTPTGWNRPLVTLTFDDGYEDNVTTVLPVLAQYGFKTTQCYETMDVEGDQQAINNVKAFYNAGHEICAHTVTHPFLTKVSATQLTYELTHSQQVLQNITGKPVTDFASPYGDYNQTVNTEIAKYFRSHRTVDEGFNSKDNFSIYRLRVQNMTPTTTLAQYQYWLDTAKATNTWLILVYHRVASSGLDPFDTYASDFKLQMQALSQSGITVETWNDALNEVVPQL